MKMMFFYPELTSIHDENNQLLTIIICGTICIKNIIYPFSKQKRHHELAEQ